jgi:hypothetical protein
LSRKEIHRLNIIANSIGKELKVNNLEQKIFNTMDSLNISYNYDEIDKTKLIYNRYGSKINYDIEGKIINIET